MRPVVAADRPARRTGCATASTATTTSSCPPAPRRPTAATLAAAGPTRRTQIYPDFTRRDRPPAAQVVNASPRTASRPRPASAGRARRPPGAPRAGRGEPAARRRPRHAAALGGRGPRPRLHDPGRPPPVRAARAGAADRRAAHRPGRAPSPASAPPPDRPVRGYRRRYGDAHALAPGPAGHASPPPPASRSASSGGASWRRWSGPSTRTGPARAAAEREAHDLAAELGERHRGHGVPLADAVAMFVAARAPAARRAARGRRAGRAWMRAASPTCTTPRPASSTGSCSRSSRPTASRVGRPMTRPPPGRSPRSSRSCSR